MGEAKRKMLAGQNGAQTGSNSVPIGSASASAPTTNRGVKSETRFGQEKEQNSQSGADRYRVNVSLPFGIHQAVNGAAEMLGASASQVALMAIMAGMPEIARQIEAAKRLTF